VEFRADANIRGDGVKSRGVKAFAFESCVGRRARDLLRFLWQLYRQPGWRLPVAIVTELGRRGRQSPVTPSKPSIFKEIDFIRYRGDKHGVYLKYNYLRLILW